MNNLAEKSTDKLTEIAQIINDNTQLYILMKLASDASPEVLRKITLFTLCITGKID